VSALPPPPLPLLRRAIDAVDDGVVALAAARRLLVRAVAARKRQQAVPLRDPLRERAVRRRALALGRRLGLPARTADALVGLLIRDACRQQARPTFRESTMSDPIHAARAGVGPSERWLGRLPPPARWRPLLALLPRRLQARALQTALNHALAQVLADGTLAPVYGRRLGLHVEDLGLRWTCELRGDGLRVDSDHQAEASVAGSATDLLLLASRQEDADTLFFQRRLRLTGDVELGLTLRNLLDRLPWEQLPLGSRVLLHRGAGLAERARRAHRVRQRAADAPTSATAPARAAAG
jgi:O2-independent ubiquinone biosynthesis accessory factor UbiT